MTSIVEHNPNDHEDPLAGPSWLVGALGAVFLVVTVLGLIALFNNVQETEDVQKVVNANPVELETLDAEQQLRLDMPYQVSSESEIATVIPIDHAMELIVQEYGEGN